MGLFDFLDFLMGRFVDFLMRLFVFFEKKSPGEQLVAAAKSGDVAPAEKLPAEGADANAKDEYGKTALIRAAGKGHTETVKRLLAEGADVNARNK
ncbi:MAG: ankyrin repeat domain-containing protein, partial [Tannerella sp.]|nr:ankyrin repeat domain-containing protein [Tannerella sp.]